jgi:FkbM family methyltransferase
VQEIDLRNGVRLRAPVQVDLAFLFHEIWIRHTYTPPGYAIQDGDVVLDVGSNIGVFAAFAASQAARVRVVAYEPNPRCLPWLRRNTSVPWKPKITVHARALAGTSGTRRLLSHDNWLLPSLSEDVSPGADTVECVTLEEAFRANSISRCDLLKLDCEGSEYEILLESSRSTLERVRRVVAEYHPSPRGDRLSLCHHLEAHSFRIDRLVETAEREGYLCATRE